MTLEILTHVAFEGPALIEHFAREEGYFLRLCRMGIDTPYDDGSPLVIMGGPMSVHDDKEFSWLKAEKAYIYNSIISGRKVLGICLGAQLIAEVLGGEVYKNPISEAGWFPLTFFSHEKIFSQFPSILEVFHWHGETFTLPPNSNLVASSEVCTNQIFTYDNGRVLALQCHLEMTQEGVIALIEADPEMLMRQGSIATSHELTTKSREYSQNIYPWLRLMMRNWLT